MIRVQGTVKIFRNIPQMANPRMQRVDFEDDAIAESRIRPIYPASAELKSDEIERIIAEQLPATVPLLDDYLDDDLRKKHNLITRAEAYSLIHHPKTMRDRRGLFSESLKNS